MKFLKTLTIMTLALCLSGCTPKKIAPTYYDQPNGPTNGLIKIIDHSLDNPRDDSGKVWVWFKFITSNHRIIEYEICADSDKLLTGMAGDINLNWDDENGCFYVDTFYRRQDLEDTKEDKK